MKPVKTLIDMRVELPAEPWAWRAFAIWLKGGKRQHNIIVKDYRQVEAPAQPPVATKGRIE